MRWKVYYRDGSTFSHEDGTPFEAPRLGVICITTENPANPKGFSTYKDANYYIWRDDRGWRRADDPGFWDHMFSGDPQCVLFGGDARDDDYWRICGIAARDDP